MEYLTNHFLIAMPQLADPNFFRSVTLICQHNADGALGVVINRLTNVSMLEIFEQMKIDATASRYADMPVYSGGPVQNERGFILHEGDSRWASTLPISDALALTTSRDILEAMAENRGPEHCLVALGYAGWSGGQLEREITDNAWLNGPADFDVVFNTPVEERWSRAAERVGIDLSRLSADSGHA
jgi:putative transcriptional regulator